MRVRRWVAVVGSATLALAGLVSVGITPAGAGDENYSLRYDDPTTGVTVEVPEGVCGAYVEAWGAEGGDGADADQGAAGALGGGSFGWIPLAPLDSIQVRVGGQGGDGFADNGPANGGLNGGGDGAPSTFADIYGGGGGGGYSGIFFAGDDNQPLIVAGGGGGGGVEFPLEDDRTPGGGGDGSGENGNPGGDGFDTSLNPVIRGGGGGGGTSSTGGAGGVSADDTDLNGLAGGYLAGGDGGGNEGESWGYGGGGGGGLYGGGGGADSFTASGGGGGGSGLMPAVLGNSSSGVHSGDGAVTISWTPCDVDLTVAKSVTGDDPGVAFPVEVECTATFLFDNKQGPGNDEADIFLTPEEPTASATVNLKNGEQADLVVSATATLDSLDCTVVEGTATLPSNYTCSAPLYLPDANPVFWDQGEFVSDSESVDIVNPCTMAVEVQPNFTG